MATKVGSARSSYGNTSAGDQHSGLEVSTQDWYLHGKGWRAFIATDPKIAKLIATAMKWSCENNDIGYDQSTRLTLYNNVRSKGFDTRHTTKKVNTDCSALVRVCIMYAFFEMGIEYQMPNFITSDEANALLKSGYFKELKGDKYTKSGDYLPLGTILVTKTKGHTVVTITAGKHADKVSIEEVQYALGDRLIKNGNEGTDVKELQTRLIQLGYDCGSWGADGDFGDDTEMAVKKFQKDAGIDIDGEVGPKTIAALKKAAEEAEKEIPYTKIKIVNGNCYIREEPDAKSKDVGVARKGTVYSCDEVSANGWHHIAKGWVSGKYSEGYYA